MIQGINYLCSTGNLLSVSGLKINHIQKFCDFKTKYKSLIGKVPVSNDDMPRKLRFNGIHFPILMMAYTIQIGSSKSF